MKVVTLERQETFRKQLTKHGLYDFTIFHDIGMTFMTYDVLWLRKRLRVLQNIIVLYPQCAFAFIPPTADYITDYMIAAADKFPALYDVCFFFLITTFEHIH